MAGAQDIFTACSLGDADALDQHIGFGAHEAMRGAHRCSDGMRRTPLVVASVQSAKASRIESVPSLLYLASKSLRKSAAKGIPGAQEELDQLPEQVALVVERDWEAAERAADAAFAAHRPPPVQTLNTYISNEFPKPPRDAMGYVDEDEPFSGRFWPLPADWPPTGSGPAATLRDPLDTPFSQYPVDRCKTM